LDIPATMENRKKCMFFSLFEDVSTLAASFIIPHISEIAYKK
jgi:hypothetical protein